MTDQPITISRLDVVAWLRQQGAMMTEAANTLEKMHPMTETPPLRVNEVRAVYDGSLPEFKPFPKIGRLSREIVVTEKLDGTNGCVHVTEHGQVLAGSRTRWITPEMDNYGFAKWVQEHVEELKTLGPGTHFGEWWGAGIQRRYGLTEKRWSLFNVAKWGETRPACCHVVPVLWRGVFDTANIEHALDRLRLMGSMAAPGFMEPEGIVIYHQQSNTLFKKTLLKDEEHKGQSACPP